MQLQYILQKLGNIFNHPQNGQGQVTYIIIFIYQLTSRLHFNSAPIMLNFSKFHYYGIKIPPASPYIVIVAATLKNKSRCKNLKLSTLSNSEFRTQIYLLRSWKIKVKFEGFEVELFINALRFELLCSPNFWMDPKEVF